MKITFLLNPETNLLDWLQVSEPILRLRQLGSTEDWQLACAAPQPLSEAMQAVLSLLGFPLRPVEPMDESDILVVAGQPTLSSGISISSGYSNSILQIVIASKDEPESDKKYSKNQLGDDQWQILERFQQALAEINSDEPTLLIGEGASSARSIGLALCTLLSNEDTGCKVAEKLGIELPPRATVAGERVASVKRKTAETQIEVRVFVDGSGRYTIQTGLPFFDHMLAQVAVHGLFDLEIQADGDLDVDAHHTVEDVALTLGKAFDRALGERRGLVRMASSSVPMDESLASVSLDFSGRPYTVFDVDWYAVEVGGISTTLIKHFFESFAVQARCNLNIRLLSGGDDHHRAEAIFKAFGRALDAATQIDPRRVGDLPSSKGAI